MKKWVFLSPHFDDVALSAGGLLWELTKQGNHVEIWTICAGDPSLDKPLTDYARMLYMFWELGEQDVPYLRSLEDEACCHVLHAGYRRYTVPDCIYRFHQVTGLPLINVPDDINMPIEPDESYLIAPVTDFLRKNLNPNCELVSPLAIGNHRDHVLTRLAAKRLGKPIWHYVDYPYVVRESYDLKEFIPAGAELFTLPISEAALGAWQEAVASYKSQMIMLFADPAEMRQSILTYASTGGGATLWKF
ncbi:MAG TPA: PIG-L family deacetylase [Anaerolineales bacterium]|nr:PIG-L family deacetylase [Anaerolineales bacterium]